MLFAAAGEKYIDNRIVMDEVDGKPTLLSSNTWQKAKTDLKKFPYSKTPVLIVDGVDVIAQSTTINRYLARRFHLLGDNELEAARIESVYDQIIELRASWNNQGEMAAKEKWAALNLPLAFQQLETFTVAHGGAAGIVGNRLSLADVVINNWLYLFSISPVDSLVKELIATHAPTLQQAIAATAANAGITEWIRTRPQTIW